MKQKDYDELMLSFYNKKERVLKHLTEDQNYKVLKYKLKATSMTKVDAIPNSQEVIMSTE